MQGSVTVAVLDEGRDGEDIAAAQHVNDNMLHACTYMYVLHVTCTYTYMRSCTCVRTDVLEGGFIFSPHLVLRLSSDRV